MKILLSISAVFLLANCASHGPVPARLYNLDDGSLVNVQLSSYRDGHGSAVAELPNGEKLKGEYTLRNIPYAGAPRGEPYVSIRGEVPSSAVPGKDERSWQEVYGYGREANAVPVGTGTLVGEKGTILHMVFFSADEWREIGDGVARSNTGHWYRFHVGATSDMPK